MYLSLRIPWEEGAPVGIQDFGVSITSVKEADLMWDEGTFSFVEAL